MIFLPVVGNLVVIVVGVVVVVDFTSSLEKTSSSTGVLAVCSSVVGNVGRVVVVVVLSVVSVFLAVEVSLLFEMVPSSPDGIVFFSSVLQVAGKVGRVVVVLSLVMIAVVETSVVEISVVVVFSVDSVVFVLVVVSSSLTVFLGSASLFPFFDRSFASLTGCLAKSISCFVLAQVSNSSAFSTLPAKLMSFFSTYLASFFTISTSTPSEDVNLKLEPFSRVHCWTDRPGRATDSKTSLLALVVFDTFDLEATEQVHSLSEGS